MSIFDTSITRIVCCLPTVGSNNRICLALGNNSALTVRDCPIVRFVCVTVSPMSPAHNPHIRSTKNFYKFIHFTETLKNEIVYIILYCVQQKETEI